MYGFFNWRIRGHPAQRIFRLQNDWPAVVNVQHSTFAILGDNHESHFDFLPSI